MPLYLAFCLGSFTLYARRRFYSCAVFSALATLARPDGLLIPIILAIDYALTEKHAIPWKAVLLFAGLTFPWFAFAFVYYGSPIPVTLVAKQQQGAMLVSQRFALRFFSILESYSKYLYTWIEAGLAALGIVYAFRFSRPWFIFLAWGVTYFSAYTLLGVSSYRWYYAPLVPVFIASVGLGIAYLEKMVNISKYKLINRLSQSNYHQILLVALLLVPLLGAQGRNLQQISINQESRFPIYQKAGEWLRINSRNEATIGSLEIGIIGYYAQRTMIDFAGLLKPEIAARLKSNGTYAISANWTANTFRPHYLVLQDKMFTQVEQGYASQNCRIAKRLSGEEFNYHHDLVIYECGVN